MRVSVEAAFNPIIPSGSTAGKLGTYPVSSNKDGFPCSRLSSHIRQSSSQGLMVKKQIAANPEQKFHQVSRLNFGKVYSVKRNVKVMNVGKVNADSMTAFESYWRSETLG
jgi:hypothetical protein